MATIRRIEIGPSRWDLMQSLFTEAPVSFTLEGGERFTGHVTTMHDHKYDDVVADSRFYNGYDSQKGTPFQDWLLIVSTSHRIETETPFHLLFIEYRELSRSGVCVVQTHDQWEAATDTKGGFDNFQTY